MFGNKVTARIHGTHDVVASKDTDGQIGSAHARNGYPVAIHINRGNTRHTLHLSTREAMELQDAIQACREGKDRG